MEIFKAKADKMNFKNKLNHLIADPRKVFLLDGFGAVLSAFSLGIILVQFESAFGMPKEKLYYLAAAAVLFAIYSFGCSFRLPNNWRPFLRFIAITNLIYCSITTFLVLRFYEELTVLGLIYFILEIIIILSLVRFELKFSLRKN